MQLDRCTVCPGHLDKHLVEMLSSMKGKLTSRHGHDIIASLDSYASVMLNGEVYVQTVRFKSCEIIVGSAKCGHCVQYRDSLRKSFHHWEKKRNPHLADVQLPPVVQTLLCSTLLRSCSTTRSSKVGQ